MKQHLLKAEHNEKFLNDIEIFEDYYDWKVTVVFYSALHYINAFLRYKNKRVGKTHKDTDDIINPLSSRKKINLPGNVYNAYSDLKRTSKNARYEWLDNSDFKQSLIKLKYQTSKESLNIIKRYFKKEGLEVK